jgi:putative alpha-1,2-mannosidase
LQLCIIYTASMKISITFASVLLALMSFQSATAQKTKDYARLVNPFIGTGGHGHTYPGAVVPFGMVQLSPDTRLEGWDGSSGYHYTDTIVYGFSHTHLSGTGIPDYCDILFMPTTGKPDFNNANYRSGFTKKEEKASPGYYRTVLNKSNIEVELTATTRVGVHRYSYPSTRQANIIIDLKHRDKVLESWIEVVNDHEIRGYRRSQSWAQDQHVYFYAKFSKPFKTYTTSNEMSGQLLMGHKMAGPDVKLCLQFDNPGEVISKVGISSVSAEGALKNLDAEVPDFNFKKVQQQARTVWNTELSKIQVEGGGPTAGQQREMQQNSNMYRGKTNQKSDPVDYASRKQIIFYTALYHTMLAPNIYSDVDGQYRGMDQQTHRAEGFNYYTVFSTWDTFRAEHPLLALIDRKRTLDFIKSFLAMYEQGKLLPIWPLASNETYCMIGNHSIPIIVDAYSKGITEFNAEEAFAAMKAAVNRNQFGLDSYRRDGAVLADVEHESVSKTVEYAYDDWCIAQMARMLKHNEDYNEYIKRAQYWKNVFNTQNTFMQARINGGWYTPFDATEINNNYTEGNSWQYTFFVPHDIEGLIARMGGKDNFEAKLDKLFTTNAKLSGRRQDDVTGLIGQYAHGNEPSHHMAYLYNFTNNPDKTQFSVNKIINEEYTNQPDGLAGNEDCGQMSAWYVMTSLGLYNIAPGQQQFQIGLPQFDKAVIKLENGKTLTISNSGASVSLTNVYLQGMNWDKKPYNKLFLNYADFSNGGELEVFTGRLPNKIFMQELERPVSKITEASIVSNPYMVAPSLSFRQPINVEIKSDEDGAQLYYTTNGTTPTANSTLYTKPITINNTTIVKAIAIKNNISSLVDSAQYHKIQDNIKLTLNTAYLPNYAAQGKESLIDGIHGTTNWRLGNWQGYQGRDLEAVIDLGTLKPVKEVSLGTLQDSRAWIVFPREVQYLTSTDGINYQLAATINSKIDIVDLNVVLQEYTAALNTTTRYIKVIAKQYGTLPKWHESQGNPSYIFADEITIN